MMLLVTYLALALPVALFIATWCTLWLAIPAVIALAYALRCLPVGGARRASPITGSTALFGIGLSTIGFCISGAGGMGAQGFDQIKHNAVLAALISHRWPVFFSDHEPLVYYLGYYLVPGLLGRIAGWDVANVALPLETWLLYTLAAFWVMICIRRHPKAGLLLFAFFSGLDPVGNWIASGQWGYNPWWAKLQFSNPAILIISVPQHVAIGWLGAAAIQE